MTVESPPTIPFPRLSPAVDAPTRPRARVRIAGLPIDPLTESQVVRHVVAALSAAPTAAAGPAGIGLHPGSHDGNLTDPARDERVPLPKSGPAGALRRPGRGGHLVTPNVDICRACARDASLRALVERADLVVADGMPLVWASRWLGTPLPGRVTGADLIWSLSEAAARHGFPVYLLGGPPGVASAAARALTRRHPGLIVAGLDAPPHGFENSPEALAAVRDRLVAAAPRLVFVGLGFPKQDLLVAALRPLLPDTWFVGCGSAIAFAAGTVRRAPRWMRRAGLEWLFRLCTEPTRLARRYLVDDLPFALRLLVTCLTRRLISQARRKPPVPTLR